VLEIVLSIYTPIVIGVLLGAGLSPGERELYFFSKVVLYAFLPALLFTRVEVDGGGLGLRC